MSYFKKFTDFCAGVAAFVAALFILRKYMAFTPDELLLEEESKFAQFVDRGGISVEIYLHLIFFLALSVAVGIIFRKLPYVCLGASVIPAIYVALMFGEDVLYEQAALYVVVAALHVVGNIFECIWRDKEDGRHRLFIGSKVVLGVSAASCFLISHFAANPPEDANFKELNLFERELYFNNHPESIDKITVIGIILLVVLAVGLILYNVYFVDALLSLIPLGYTLYLFFLEELLICPAVFLALTGTCALTNVFLMVFENNLSQKEQKKLKET